MTVEQIELRKILTQMLADNGINRETIKGFVEEIVSEKVDRAIDRIIHETNMDSLIARQVQDTIRTTISDEVRWNVRRVLQFLLKPMGVSGVVNPMARDEVWDALKNHAKQVHSERVAKNPDRIAYAIQQFEAHGIEYQLKNEQTGHFHCWRKSDDKLFQFYAGTGKIQGFTQVRGIHSLIQMLEG